ncbi:MAG: hypothetical protein WC221_00170 [Candidatus Riflebacteria bacterium]
MYGSSFVPEEIFVLRLSSISESNFLRVFNICSHNTNEERSLVEVAVFSSIIFLLRTRDDFCIINLERSDSYLKEKLSEDESLIDA